MKAKMLWVVVLLGLLARTLSAQDIAGDWQGILKSSEDFRIILHIEKGNDGGWAANMYSIDQGSEEIPVTSVILQGSNLKLTVDQISGRYEGKISADGTSITGIWTRDQPRSLDFHRATKETAWPRDPSPHTVQFITVDNSVKLEVLDWGGSGSPLVLLAGLGNTAHVFDKLAPKLTASHHVYGITRRGFGASSVPASGYSADRLGDDVLEVMESLKLQRPVLIGHSIAGEELSSVGSRQPQKVRGLIYLDAGYPYAFYDRSRGNLLIDRLALQKKLERLLPGMSPQDQKQAVQELLQTDLPQFEKDLQRTQKNLQAEPARPPGPAPQIPAPVKAVLDGEQKYTDIKVPILAIYALPHTRPGLPDDPAARAAAEARDLEDTGAQAKAFETGVPSAHVVRLPHASHFVFESNEADVLREINTFLGSLP